MTWDPFLSLARSKLGLCSANHRTDYFSNLACDWLHIVWAHSEQETENGPCKECLRSDNIHLCLEAFCQMTAAKQSIFSALFSFWKVRFHNREKSHKTHCYGDIIFQNLYIKPQNCFINLNICPKCNFRWIFIITSWPDQITRIIVSNMILTTRMAAQCVYHSADLNCTMLQIQLASLLKVIKPAH